MPAPGTGHKPLVSARLLLSLKGPRGGYRLARPADHISLLDVLEAVDAPVRGQAPFFEGGNGPLQHRLEAVCGRVAALVREHFGKVSLSELVSSKGKKPGRAADPEEARPRPSSAKPRAGTLK